MCYFYTMVCQAQFQLVKCASRRGGRWAQPVPTFLRIGKDDMAPVFGEGGNLPTRFFELDREMLKREGFDFEKFAKPGMARDCYNGARKGKREDDWYLNRKTPPFTKCPMDD